MYTMAASIFFQFFFVFNKIIANNSFLVLHIQVLGIYCFSLKPELAPDDPVMIERSPSHEFQNVRNDKQA